MKGEIFDPDERVQVRRAKRLPPINGRVLGHAWWKPKGVQVELDDGQAVWVKPEFVRRLGLLELMAEAAQ